MSCLFLSRSIRKFLSDSLRILGLVSLTSSLLESDSLSCSEIVGDLDPVGLEVFLKTFYKIKSGFGFSLRSFCLARGLGTRSLNWIYMTSVSLLNFGQFPENALCSASQW